MSARLRSALLACLLGSSPAAALSGTPPPEAPKAIDPTDLEDLQRVADRIRPHVAYLDVEVEKKADFIVDLEDWRDGFGVIVGERRVAALCFLVQDARRVRVVGTEGRKLEAKVLLYDATRRVAILETERPVAEIGLSPAAMAPKKERSLDLPVFALITTEGEPAVLSGVLTDTGEDSPELEGLIQSDLDLKAGMPVFDGEARFVGYARTVAWDKNRKFLVPPEKITEASTATRAAARKPPGPTARKRPGRSGDSLDEVSW